MLQRLIAGMLKQSGTRERDAELLAEAVKLAVLIATPVVLVVGGLVALGFWLVG